MRKLNGKYDSVKEQVLANVSKSNRTNKYKCAVSTLEAQISKPADILAYMKSDVMTGFSKGIISKLSDDYLEAIGKLLAETEGETLDVDNEIEQATPQHRKELMQIIRNFRISQAKKIIRQIKIDKLRETEDDIYSDSNEEIFEELDKYIEQLDGLGIEITDIKPEELATIQRIKEKILNQFKEKNLKQGRDINTANAQTYKLEQHIRKVEKNRKRVIEELMTKVQDTLREDYIKSTLKRWEAIEKDESLSDEERYSLKKQSMDFSEKVNKIIYGRNGIKDLNYREIVQYAKKVYQTGCLPKAFFELVEESSKAIVNTGSIINKFYDPEILKHIKNDELITLMHQRDINVEKDKKYRDMLSKIKKRANSIERVTNLQGRRYTSKKTKQKIAKFTLYSDIARYIDEQQEGFARTCEDVYYAIPYTVKSMVEKAVRSEYEEAQYLPDEERKEVNKIRKELAKKFGKTKKDSITKDALESFINEKIEKERKQIELKVATRFCLDYISGKTDRGIKELVINTGMVSREKFDSEDRPNLEGIKTVRKLSQALRDEDDSMQK